MVKKELAKPKTVADIKVSAAPKKKNLKFDKAKHVHTRFLFANGKSHNSLYDIVV